MSKIQKENKVFLFFRLQRHSVPLGGRNIADVVETLNIVAVLSNNAFVLSIIVAVLTIIDADLTSPLGLNPFWLPFQSLLPAALQFFVRQCLSPYVYFNQKPIPVIDWIARLILLRSRRFGCLACLDV